MVRHPLPIGVGVGIGIGIVSMMWNGIAFDAGADADTPEWAYPTWDGRLNGIAFDSDTDSDPDPDSGPDSEPTRW
jgi:hypothetical protein